MKSFKIKDVYNTSNLLSIARLFLAIPLWFILDQFPDANARNFAFLLALFAAATDILDGYLARKMNQVTEFGKIIDPLADKIAMGAVVIKLFIIGAIPAYFFFMIIIRDVLIFIGGIIVSRKLGRVLPSNVLGKITVIVIGLVILMIFLQVERSSLVYLAFYYLSIVLIFVSLAGYILRAYEFLRQEKLKNGNI